MKCALCFKTLSHFLASYHGLNVRPFLMKRSCCNELVSPWGAPVLLVFQNSLVAHLMHNTHVNMPWKIIHAVQRLKWWKQCEGENTGLKGKELKLKLKFIFLSCVHSLFIGENDLQWTGKINVKVSPCHTIFKASPAGANFLPCKTGSYPFVVFLKISDQKKKMTTL